jgi:hypothetical protein
MKNESNISAALNWNTLLKLIFKIFGHIFIFSAMFWVITLGRPIPADLTSFVLSSTVMGYFGIVIIIQLSYLTLKSGKEWRRLALVAVYATIGLLQIIYILNYVNVVWTIKVATIVDNVTNTVLLITAISGLISSIAGILSQLTLRKKMAAEIEIEKQKLELERERIQIEKERLEKAKTKKPQ